MITSAIKPIASRSCCLLLGSHFFPDDRSGGGVGETGFDWRRGVGFFGVFIVDKIQRLLKSYNEFGKVVFFYHIEHIDIIEPHRKHLCVSIVNYVIYVVKKLSPPPPAVIST